MKDKKPLNDSSCGTSNMKTIKGETIQPAKSTKKKDDKTVSNGESSLPESFDHLNQLIALREASKKNASMGEAEMKLIAKKTGMTLAQVKATLDESVDIEEGKKIEPSAPDAKAAAMRKAIEKSQAKKKKDDWFDDEDKPKARRMGGRYGYGKYDESVELEEAFTDKQIKMAYGILNDKRYKGGDLTHAVRAIEKIAKGLSDHPGVQRAMKATNESVEVAEAKEVTPKDVESYLVKTGVNPKDAKEAVKKGFGYANKKYGGSTHKAAVKKIAEVVWTLHEDVRDYKIYAETLEENTEMPYEAWNNAKKISVVYWPKKGTVSVTNSSGANLSPGNLMSHMNISPAQAKSKVVQAIKSSKSESQMVSNLAKLTGQDWGSLTESVELDEAFKKGDSVTVKNARKYDALSKPEVSGTVIGMNRNKVMVKVGSGQMDVDARDLMKESVELDEAKDEIHHVIDKKTGKKANKKPMSMGTALDFYDSLGGNAKGYAVVKDNDKRIKESLESVMEQARARRKVINNEGK